MTVVDAAEDQKTATVKSIVSRVCNAALQLVDLVAGSSDEFVRTSLLCLHISF